VGNHEGIGELRGQIQLKDELTLPRILTLLRAPRIRRDSNQAAGKGQFPIPIPFERGFGFRHRANPGMVAGDGIRGVIYNFSWTKMPCSVSAGRAGS
jgi:hypothetical protein